LFGFLDLFVSCVHPCWCTASLQHCQDICSCQ